MGCSVVETSSGKLALRFRWTYPDGSVRRPSVTTELDSSLDNRRALRARAAVIGAELQAGTFDPVRHFEIPPRFGVVAKKAPPRVGSVALRMRAWIDEKIARKVRDTRPADYEKHLRNYVEPSDLGRLEPSHVGDDELSAFQLWLVSEAGEGRKGVSEKTASNVIRGTLAAFFRDIRAIGALEALGRLRWEQYEPGNVQDPFTAKDRDALLLWFEAKRPRQEYLSLRLRFIGITPSEVRGLNVGDLDRSTETIRVQRSRSENLKVTRATKTKRRRRAVHLEADLVAMLAELAGLRGPAEALLNVFESSLTKTFTRAQAALGVSYRPIYQAKHTYAVLAILSGERGSVVANHLGITLATLEKHYAAALQRAEILAQLDQEIGPRKATS